MTDQEKDIKGIIKNSANKQSNAPVVKEELIGRYDRKKTISLIRYVLQKMEDKNTPFVPLHYTLIALYNSLALLSDLEPRVMTLEEAAVSDFCYVEYSTGDIIPAFVRFAVMACEIKSYKIQTDLGHSYFCADKYGKILRCWTSRPTDEQREATPWES